jgi:histidinol phosphatase-like enzyme (inositol monophosphatase family)
MMPYKRELALARRLSAEAGALALEYRERGVTAEDKSDDSPVTAADRAAEKLIVEALTAEFPDDGILGEEGASRESKSGRKWIIDPIDGTRDYVRGSRMWTNLLALEEDGEVVLGVSTFPMLEESIWAVKGEGAWRTWRGREERMRCSSIASIDRAVACITQINKIPSQALGQRIPAFLENFWAVRSMGGAYDAILVSSGSAEVWIEAAAKPWDFAALRIIAVESGCRFFDANGDDSIYTGSGFICVPALENEVRRFLGLADLS